MIPAFHAENAFRSVLSLSGIVGDVHIHGTYALAFPAGNTLLFVTLDAHEGKIAHGF